MNTNHKNGGPVLLLGSTGMLGKAWRRLLAGKGIPFSAPTSDELDITSQASLRMISSKFTRVINCTGYTDVDAAETDQKSAQNINSSSVGRLAAVCAKQDISLVHYSTDYVFSGTGSIPYETEAATCPVNVYGKTKADGERLIQESGCRHILIRTSWLYSSWGPNFVRTMLSFMQSRDFIQVVDDQLGTPTSVEHLASSSLRLMNSGQTGTFHITDGGSCTWYGFALAIQAASGIDCQLVPCRSDQFVRPATRPQYSVLDVSRTEEVLGMMPDWRPCLADTLHEIHAAALPNNHLHTMPLNQHRSESR